MSDFKIVIRGQISHPEFLPDYKNIYYFSDLLNYIFEYSIQEHGLTPQLKVISDFLSEEHPLVNEEYLLETFTRETISISTFLMSTLSKGDIVNSSCFIPKDTLGESLIWLLEKYNLEFVMVYKYWESSKEVEIYFEVCQRLWSHNLANILTIGYDPTTKGD